MSTAVSDASRWERMYQQSALNTVRHHFDMIRQSPFMLEFLRAVLERCPAGGRALETGIGSGHGSIWLSLRDVRAEGIDIAPRIVERAKYVNNILDGEASFRVGDLFDLYDPKMERYNVIFHQGVLEHFDLLRIRSALSRQVCMADYVVFSVPSSYYMESEFGDERFITLDGWKHIVSPFHVEEIKLYGDPRNQEREHVLCILRGQRITDKLRSMMTVPENPYPPGITAIVHTRNEGYRLKPCLEALIAAGIDQLIVCDMESDDDTVAVATECGAEVVHYNLVSQFDKARNCSAIFARFSHILYIDADEIVRPEMVRMLRAMAVDNIAEFNGMYLPFNHYFCGHVMRCLAPGYTTTRFLRNGKFHFATNLHSGCHVDGPTTQFPPDPNLAIEHFSYASIEEYINKQARYTTGEAETMFHRGQQFDSRQMLLHALQDWVGYYDRGNAPQDGPYGLIYSLLSAYYRILQHSKLFVMRANAGLLKPDEMRVPANTGELLALVTGALSYTPKPEPAQIRVITNDETGSTQAARVVLSGPLLDSSGIGEESRNFALAAHLAGIQLHARNIPWNDQTGLLNEQDQEAMDSMTKLPVSPGFLHIIQDFPNGWLRYPGAGKTVVRTMFETDRLPPGWAEACNQMDAVWVPTEFNRRSFIDAGVDAKKIVVIPGCFDPVPYLAPYQETELTGYLAATGKKILLSTFDWTRHKGWDALLRSFFQITKDRDDLLLVLKVWSTNGYSAEDIIAQASQFVNDAIDSAIDLRSDPCVRFVTEKLSRSDLISLHKSADLFVLPTRGEGFGRPIMESMMCGVPTIATNWSGPESFLHLGAFPLNYRLVPVPEAGWRELPTYKGSRWAEPDTDHLAELMLSVLDNPDAARQVALQGQKSAADAYSRETVGKQLKAEVERLLG